MTGLKAIFNRIWPRRSSRMPPLLITSSVHAYAPFVELTDCEERISLTLEALEKWLAMDRGLNVVLCDGSSFDFSERIKTRFPEAEIECLFFENDQDAVSQFGKGWGEGEIVNYALGNSTLLREAPFFAKCTSKVFVTNFAALFKFWNGSCLFNCRVWDDSNPDRIGLKEIDTMFYIVDKRLYLRKFSTAHLNVRDRERHYLEHCFKDVVLREKIERFLLPIMPLYEGVSGTTAKPYPPVSADESKKDAAIRGSIGKLTNYLASS